MTEPGGAHLDLEGTFNTRDVGGVTTTGGATVATGRLLRSASLDALTEADIDQLRSLELRTVIDLRSHDEVDRHGRFPVDELPVRWEHLPAGPGPPSSGGPNPIVDHPDPMAFVYQATLESGGAEFARGLRIVSDAANHTAVVHCTSGKDRTGLFVLLLHLVLGVSLDDALAHYHQTAGITDRVHRDMLVKYPTMAQLPAAKVERMAGTNSRWVTGALSAIGGVDAVPAWLEANGCDAHSQARLRAAFLD